MLTLREQSLDSSVCIAKLEDLPRKPHLEFIIPERSSRTEPFPHRCGVQDTAILRSVEKHLDHEFHVGERGEDSAGRVQYGTEVVLNHRDPGN